MNEAKRKVGKWEVKGNPSQVKDLKEADLEPDWQEKCAVCGALPTLPLTGMCGPCTFGEADSAGGNW